MTRFYVYRRGYNTANHPARDGNPETVRVAEVEADYSKQAVALALEAGVTCYGNQAIWAERADKVDRRKRRLKRRVKFACFVLVLALAAAGRAAEIPYDFRTVDLLPEEKGFAWLADINDKGDLVARAVIPGGPYPALIATQLTRRGEYKRTRLFDCGFTQPFGLNNAGVVVGNCDQGAFIAQPDGSYLILSGVSGAGVWGLSSEGYVSGNYTDADGGHGFSWHPVAGYQTIDFPLDPHVYPTRLQRLIGRDRTGQVLGTYFAYNSLSGFFESSFWLYDNGTFSLPFPQLTGNGYDFYDVNDSGQMIGARYGTDGGAAIFLYDDGVFYDVSLPTGWFFAGLGGLNNKGEFVGTYRIRIGTNPVNGSPISEWHGFIATPAKGRSFAATPR